MTNPATVTKTLTITMLSLSAGKVRFPAVAASIAAPLPTKPTAKLPAPRASGPVVPVAPVQPPLPTAKDGFHLMLAAGDGTARSYGTKLLALCDGKASADRGATDMGAIPDSLATAIVTLQSEVAAFVTSLTGAGKLTF